MGHKHFFKNQRAIPKWMIWSLSIVIAFFVLSVGLYGFYSVSFADKIFPNVVVGVVEVGGKTSSEAQILLQNKINEFVNASLPIKIDNQDATVKVQDLGAVYDLTATITKAQQVGRSGALFNDAVDQIVLLWTKKSLNVAVTTKVETLDKVVGALSKKFDQPEEDANFDIDEDGTITINPENVGWRFDHDRLTRYLQSSLESVDSKTEIDLGLNRYLPKISTYQIEALRPSIEKIVAEKLILSANDKTIIVDKEQIGSWLKVDNVRTQNQLGGDGFYGIGANNVELVVDEEAVTAYLKTIAQNIDRKAVDAKLKIENGRATIFQPSQDGLSLQIEPSKEAILQDLEARKLDNVANKVVQSKVALSISVTSAAVTSQTIETLGIKELIGTAETDFQGSPSNRVHNITNGAKFLNGLLIKPGDEFSTVKALGQIDDSNGYLPELVIKNNRTIPEFGGGLCQVSTTLFRSVLNAGLKVTERRNHTYRVNYYERGIGPGLDATIYLPKPDFKFLNDTLGWILVQGQVEGNKITFELYGTSDGRKAEIKGPFTLSTTPAPAAVYEDSNDILEGETKQIEKPHDGAKTVAYYKVYDKDGNIKYDQTFSSSYKALPARYLVGKKVAQAPESSADQTTEAPASTTADSPQNSADEGQVAGDRTDGPVD